MGDMKNIIIAGAILFVLLILPGLIGFWRLEHSIILCVLIGAVWWRLENRRKEQN